MSVWMFAISVSDYANLCVTSYRTDYDTIILECHGYDYVMYLFLRCIGGDGMTNVTVYTSSQCLYCVMIKNFLNDKEIPFKEVNVETKPEMMQQLFQKTGQMGVPQTEINGKWVVGFDPNRIMAALN